MAIAAASTTNVVPAQAGTQFACATATRANWAPAFAGATVLGATQRNTRRSRAGGNPCRTTELAPPETSHRRRQRDCGASAWVPACAGTTGVFRTRNEVGWRQLPLAQTNVVPAQAGTQSCLHALPIRARIGPLPSQGRRFSVQLSAICVVPAQAGTHTEQRNSHRLKHRTDAGSATAALQHGSPPARGRRGFHDSERSRGRSLPTAQTNVVPAQAGTQSRMPYRYAHKLGPCLRRGDGLGCNSATSPRSLAGANDGYSSSSEKIRLCSRTAYRSVIPAI